MKNLFDIQGQVVVITGGTGVLGREIGEYLALQGAKVVLMGRNEETGKQIVGGIRGKGGEAMFLRTDVMNPAGNMPEWSRTCKTCCRPTVGWTLC